MYEMCAGQPPFGGNSALAILKQVSEAKYRPLRELNPDVPDWLAETIDMLLAKKPADRIQTANHLVELLEYEWALTKTTSEDLPTVCQVEARKEKIRNRLIAAAIGTTFLGLGLIGGLILAHRGGTKSSEAIPVAEPVALLNSNSGAVDAIAFDPAGSTLAMAVDDGSVRLWDWQNKSIKATFNRGTITSAVFTKGDSWQRLVRWFDPSLEASPAGAGKDIRIRRLSRGWPSPDGRTIYSGDLDGAWQWSIDSDKPVASASNPIDRRRGPVFRRRDR